MRTMGRRWIAGLTAGALMALALTLPAGATHYMTLQQQFGADAGDAFGSAACSLRDVDGDGIADYIVGAPLANPSALDDAGAAYLFSGATGTLIRAHFGTQVDEHFGFSVAGLRDVDGDLVPDYAVGAPEHDGGFVDDGLVRVFSGAGGAEIYSISLAEIAIQEDFPADGLETGWAITSLGDTTGDGLGEVLISAPGFNLETGLVALISPGPEILWWIPGLTEGDGFGHSLSHLADMDGDEIVDFIVGSPGFDLFGTDNGAVELWSGAGAGNSPVFLDSWGHIDDNALFGWSVAGYEDSLGNWYADWITGAPGAFGGAGAAYLFSGSIGIAEYQGEAVGDALGFSVAMAPDPIPDPANLASNFIIGAPGANPGGLNDAGTAYFMSGIDGSQHQQFDGQHAGDALGSAVAGLRDLNGDGLAEMLFGAPGEDVGPFGDAGAAYMTASPGFVGHTTAAGGAPVSGVTVTATSSSSEASGQSDTSGYYAVGDLPAGASYTLTASGLGIIGKSAGPFLLGGASERVNFQVGTVSVTSPANSATVSGLVTVSATASDPSGIQFVDFLLDGATPLGHDTTAPYSALWDTGTDCALAGPHSLQAVATAGDGQTGTSVAVNVTVTTAGGGSFSDVPCTHFAFAFIEAVNAAGIASGFPDGTFRPDNLVNRNQMAVFMARTADLTLGDFAAFTPPACGSETFSDVACSHASYKFIEYVVAKGIAAGFPDGTYKPGNTVSRGAMAVFLARVRNLADGDFAAFAPPACGSESFPDVPCTHASYKFIEYVKAKGIAAGFGDGTYRPGVTVTRAQMAVFVARAANLTP